MIGFLFGLLHIVGLTTKGLSEIHEINERKRYAIQNGYDSYMDRNGNMRYTENDQAYIITKDRYGDALEIDPYSGKVLKNISHEQRREKEKIFEKKREEARDDDKKFILYDVNLCGRPHFRFQIAMFGKSGEYIGYGKSEISYPDQYITGEIWQNVDNKRLYVKRTLKPYDYIIDEDLLLNDVHCEGKHNHYYADVYLCLTDGLIQREFTEWNKQAMHNADQVNIVPDDEREMIDKKIDYLNMTDANGRFIHRNGTWMNYGF